MRKEYYYRNHPELLECKLFSESEIRDYNRRIARNRRVRCIIGIRQTGGKLKIVSRCRRHHYRSNVVHERSPLISHWIASDESEDEVFESPNPNSRYMSKLSSESKERVDAIQNFEPSTSEN